MKYTRKQTALTLLILCLFFVACFDEQPADSSDQPTTAPTPIAKSVDSAPADKLFDEKNYAEAAAAYRKVAEQSSDAAEQYRTGEREVICHLRLSEFDNALAAAELVTTRAKGTPWEPRAERMVGNLYLVIPKWGTRSGGVFHRGKWTQGIRLYSYSHDKKLALQHLEKARDLYAHYEENPDELKPLEDIDAAKWRVERIGCLIDLAGACSRYGIYENQPNFWHMYWADRDDTMAQTAGEEDFDEYQHNGAYHRERPIGLQLDKDGNPIFAAMPDDYHAELGDEEKLLYLLAEVRELDNTDNKRFAAEAWYRQAMLARTRFGMDRMNHYAGNYYIGGSRPLQDDLDTFHPWELGDSEAIVLAGGQVKRVTLPEQWDVLSLLSNVKDTAPTATESRYAAGLYQQSRQQYPKAIDIYRDLVKTFPQDQWTQNAKSQEQRILAEQVRINNSSLQLAGEQAQLQISYRNVDQVWFIAYRVDHKGYMDELRDKKLHPKYGYQNFWHLQSWHNSFVNGYHKNNENQVIAAKHIGKAIATWTHKVEPGEGHRYAQATLPTPLLNSGAYIVLAYPKEPDAKQSDLTPVQVMSSGNSRAIVALSDLAFVEKKTEQGNLYYVSHAQTGAPVVNATVQVLEIWNTYDQKQRKSIFHREMHEATTNEQGIATLKQPERRHGQLHTIVTLEDRFAWGGMNYWNPYHPSGQRSGRTAYVITDRPVYRPLQQVNYKAWIRDIANGQYRTSPGKNYTIAIYDPRGNKINEQTHALDEFGGLDGSLTLDEEPPLGVYQIQIAGTNYVGGQSFRVEEYKKPEFEVTVEPGTTHAKLGEEITASIKAKYYFGSPVTNGKVSYKVFRETYNHSFYFPGRWDWLYGPGYGWAWYDAPWFDWWSVRARCWSPPHWWWGYYGGGAPTSHRELVMQGEAELTADGKLDIKIDTADALKLHGDQDHQYIIQAEVRDESRRVISGEGSVKVTRQAYYAMIQPERGYYRPGEQINIDIKCLTPGNKPVQTEGIVTISSVVFGGPDNAKIEETQLDQFKASTDKDGNLRIQHRYEKSGQLKIKFTAPDQWGGQVAGYALVWVCGRDFDGKLHRFNDLEIITDKREYQPGEVAHVMINTKRASSYVLYSDEVDNHHLLSWKLLHLPNKTTMIDIPVTKDHQPNFFVEATTISDLRVHQQVSRICVPPADGVLDVAVEYDKSQYKPGEMATVNVTAMTPDGKPAQAQLTLSAFDQSVLYIAGETSPMMAKFFHGNLKHHSQQMATNLMEQFSATGYVYRPFQQLHPYPQAWHGIWGAQGGDWRVAGDWEDNNLFLADGETLSIRGGVRELQRSRGMAPAAAPMAKSASRAVAQDSLGVAMEESDAAFASGGALGGDAGSDDAANSFVEAEVRTEFADTALWLTTLTTDSDGRATTSFKMPENLTTWQLNTWAMTRNTRVGQSSANAVTTKNLLVRLQSPRFFTERDEVVLSANVHNYLASPKTVRVSLDIPTEHLAFMEGHQQTVDIEVPANGEKRVDWRVKVLAEGNAAVTVKALTDEESDAMQLTLPVLVHGMMKQVATSGSMRPNETDRTIEVQIDVPNERRPDLSRLQVQFTPSLVGAMLDALPYCLDYPYGCTEQTMSRFMPAVLTLKTLQNMGITLEDVKDVRGRLAEVRRAEKDRRLRYYTYADSPVFDSDKLDDIVDKGLKRITSMQNPDGGWGWWKDDQSSGYLTSYVLYALITAQASDVKVDKNIIERGMRSLVNWEMDQMRKDYWSPHAQHAFAAYVLSMRKQTVRINPNEDDKRPAELIERLWEGRDKLNLYGKSLLTMALHNLEDDRAKTVLQNILQYKVVNEKTQVAHFKTPNSGWWYWWNNDIETNAWALRAIVAVDPNSDLAPMIVKWLLNNRRNGYYWRSTRDTALCIAAMSDFVNATGEADPDYELTFDYDNGAVTKTVKINKDNFLTFDNQFLLEGKTLTGGKHTLKITKKGKGALYFNTYLNYFTMEEPITASGHEMHVERKYFRLKQMPFEVEVEDSKGNKVMEQRLRYERIELSDGDKVESGELVQVELKVTSDNDYTFLAFEDPKPAGMEPIDLTSGGKGQEGFHSYMELRDEKVVFFVNQIQEGEHLMRYRLRAEVPGVFHALPAHLFAMYVPELKANSDERVIRIVDVE